MFLQLKTINPKKDIIQFASCAKIPVLFSFLTTILVASNFYMSSQKMLFNP